MAMLGFLHDVVNIMHESELCHLLDWANCCAVRGWVLKEVLRS